MKKVLITGITPTHINDPNRSPTTKFVSAPIILAHALRELGYDVEWRQTDSHEDLSQFFRIFAFTYPRAISEEARLGWEHACQAHQAILCFDDWDYQNALMPDHKMPMLGCWCDWGTKALRGAGFEDAMTWDPGAWLDVSSITTYEFGLKAHRWLHAAFPQSSHDWVSEQMLRWPVQRWGAPSMPRILESELVLKMRSNLGVIAAPYSHIGSGWWRSRYNYALCSSSLIGAQAGEFPGVITDPRTIEQMSSSERYALMIEQFLFVNTRVDQRARLIQITEEVCHE